jgi:hypothetical protein
MHKHLLYSAFGLTMLGLTACSSGGGDDAPNIAGDYLCTAGCIGACDFAPDLSITQDGNQIILETDTESFTGNVNSDGEINYSSDRGNCEGLLVQGTAVIECEFDDVDCQQVTYKRQ